MAKVYIAGRMNGLPEHNFPQFNSVAKHLQKLGHEVVSPVDVGEKYFNNDVASHTQQEFMEKDIMELLTCDTICLLPGWEDGTGAVMEAAIAKGMGFDFMLPSGTLYPAPDQIIVKRGFTKNFLSQAV